MKDDSTEQVGPAGRGSALTLLVFLPEEVQSFRLPEAGSVQLGRGEEATFQILDRSVSRLHAALVVSGADEVSVTDLGSSNGTRLRGAALAPHRAEPVRLGETLEFGQVAAVVQYSPAQPQIPRGVTQPVRLAPPAATPLSPNHVVSAPAMIELYRLASRGAASPLSVLLLGETGVGKEALAEHLHACSPRAGRALVRLNCAALPEALLESELFGHVRGAFTGADQDKRGVLEAADGGTVLLDEIGELPLGTQAKILRVVERGELLSIGSLKVKTVDIRFIAATNRDLPKEAAAGRFRLDLYHRLNGVSLRIPPLRSRREEILPLAAAFARAHLTRMRRPEAALRLSPPAEALLLAHPWPGNVRELKHAIERALVLADEGPIEPQHLQLGEEQDFGLAAPALAVARSEPLSPSEVAEAQRIRDALEECGGNQAKAAKLLGIARGTLASRMDRFGIGRPRK